MDNINTYLPDIKLRFNIDHPDLEDCYHEGYESAVEEIALTDNPFVTGSLEHEYWQEGWWAGFYEEQPSIGFDNIDHAPKIAANEGLYHYAQDFFVKFIQISSAIAVTALVGYQVLDLVA